MKPPPDVPKVERIHPLTAFVRRLDGEFYTRYEVAEALEVAPRYLYAILGAHPELAPSASVQYRGKMLRLYSRDDLNRLALHFQDHELRGPPRLRPVALVQQKERLRRRINRYRERAETEPEEKERARLLGLVAQLAEQLAAL